MSQCTKELCALCLKDECSTRLAPMSEKTKEIWLKAGLKEGWLKQCPKCGHIWKPRAQRSGSKERQQRCPKCHTRKV